MTTIEEQAKEYFKQFSKKNQHRLMSSNEIEGAYIAGANEALSRQWRSLDDKPQDGTKVMIFYEAKDLTGKPGEFYCVFEYHSEIGFLYLEDALKGFDLKIIAWMPIPQLPKIIDNANK